MHVWGEHGAGCLLLSQKRDGGITILHADPEIQVTEEFLYAVRAGYCKPEITLGDGILTVQALNGTVSYGLHSFDLLRNWWAGTRGMNDWRDPLEDVA
jgi:hypothetical protein